MTFKCNHWQHLNGLLNALRIERPILVKNDSHFGRSSVSSAAGKNVTWSIYIRKQKPMKLDLLSFKLDVPSLHVTAVSTITPPHLDEVLHNVGY